MKTKKELLKIIKKIEKKNGVKYDLRDDNDADLLFADLKQAGVMDFGVYGRGDFGGSDYWLQAEYYSKKLQRTVIWDHDVGNFDDIDEVADFIIHTSKELVAFEKKLKKIK